MFYALIHYPNIPPEPISQLRQKYDPHYNVMGPHITLLFPVPESVGENQIVHHIQNVLRDRYAFSIRLHGLARSWDDYLFLLVQEGRVDLIGLYDALYTGLLADYRRKDLQFTPHVTLGRFTLQPDKHQQAFDDANQLSLDYECVMDRLHLVKIHEEPLQIVWSKEFLLQAVP